MECPFLSGSVAHCELPVSSITLLVFFFNITSPAISHFRIGETTLSEQEKMSYLMFPICIVVLQLSYADTDPIFTSASFPNFFRMVPNENAFNAPRIKLLQYFNWTRVGTIYQNEPRFSLVSFSYFRIDVFALTKRIFYFVYTRTAVATCEIPCAVPVEFFLMLSFVLHVSIFDSPPRRLVS